jgi:hypothetical protein
VAATAYDTARELFFWANGNAQRTADVQAAYDLAGANPIAKGGLDSVLSATKNNVTMQKTVGLNELDRIKALRWALAWLDTGRMPSKRTIGVFF